MENDFNYPIDYLDYINNIEEYEVYSSSGFIELFPFSDLYDINDEYEIQKFAPDFIAIGSNGGGVGIFINKRNSKYYSMPFIGMWEKDAILLADNFGQFLNYFLEDKIEIL